VELSSAPPYGQFCPVAKAMELLDERWTVLVVRELLSGSMHFNDRRRGVPKMSPVLLSKRLQTLIRAGVVERSEADGRTTYTLTPCGKNSSMSSKRSARGASAGSATSATGTSIRTC
jgi:DNA-binding HxlR family transcriptional regulator